MSKRLPPLNALRTFDAAARHLSFTKAAEELFVTQAAVSHQVKLLEEFFGVQLFRRLNRALLLTEEGQSYYHDIKEIFQQLQLATEKLQARQPNGILTVSVLTRFALQWLLPKLAQFKVSNPGLEVRLQMVDSDVTTLSDDVDLAIFYGTGEWPHLTVDRVQGEYLIPLCSPQLLTGKHALKTLADLQYHTLLHAVSRKDWQVYSDRWQLPALDIQQGPIFSHSQLVVQSAVHGKGVALLPQTVVQNELATGSLVCPFSEVLIGDNAFYLVGHEQQGEVKKVMAFRNWILQMATEEQRQSDCYRSR